MKALPWTGDSDVQGQAYWIVGGWKIKIEKTEDEEVKVTVLV